MEARFFVEMFKAQVIKVNIVIFLIFSNSSDYLKQFVKSSLFQLNTKFIDLKKTNKIFKGIIFCVMRLDF